MALIPRKFLGHGSTDGDAGTCHHQASGEGIGAGSMLHRQPPIWRDVVHRVDVSDDRRTAVSLFDVDGDEIPDVITELARANRLSIVMKSLNRLLLNPADRELGRRALRHLGFFDD